MRLQVFLSHNGVYSRRRAMELIQQGLVTVNGQLTTEPSWKVFPERDQVTVSGKLIAAKQYEYVILNKPQGYVTTMAEHRGEKSVLELLPEEYHHLKPVGRLDRDTEGLLLFTNDGDVAYKLTHPKFNVDKVYYVEIRGQMSEVSKRKLEKGVSIEGEMTSPAKIIDVCTSNLNSPKKTNVEILTTAVNISSEKVSKDVKSADGKTNFYMTIHEGKKRQIRLMCKAVDHEVDYLKRISQGPLALGNLKSGQWRRLTVEEIKSL